MEFWLILIVFLLFTILKSAFGFGGAIFSVLVLGFFVEIKSVILIGLLVMLYSDLFILWRDHQGLSWPLYGRLILFSAPTLVIGALAIDLFSSAWLLKAFALFTLAGALLPFLRITPGPWLSAFLLLLAGLAQGAFGTGGPLAVSAARHHLADRHQFRTSFSAYFITVNAVRFVQLVWIQESYSFADAAALWWLPLPVYGAVWIGRHIHQRMSNRFHHEGVSLLLLAAAAVLLFK